MSSSSRVWTIGAIAVAAAALAGTYPVGRHGLRGTFYRSDNWTGESATRVDLRPSDTGPWVAIGPDPPQRLSAAWIGSLVVDRADTYELGITTSAKCRASVDPAMTIDTERRTTASATLQPGVYTLAIQCSTTRQKLNLGVWWERAGTPARPLSPDVTFPYSITLQEFRTLRTIEHTQQLLIEGAAVLAVLLVVAWLWDDLKVVPYQAFRKVGAAAVVATAVATAAIHFDWLPWLRGPSEWQWGFQNIQLERPAFMAVACGVALLAALGLTGTHVARRQPRAAAAVLLAVAIVAGFWFQMGLLDLSAAGWRQSLIVSAWSDLGFLRSAAWVSAMPPSEAIRRYREIMPTLAFKATTHPPGPTMMFRFLIAAARHAGIAGIEPEVVFGLPTVTRSAPVTRVALAGALVWAASASLTALPIALAVWAITRKALHAAVVGMFWLVCPSPTVMSPSLDQLDTLLVACSFASVLIAQANARRPAVWAAAGGAIGGLSLFFSYGTAPMLATALLMAAMIGDRPDRWRRFTANAGWWMAGVAAAVLAPVAAFRFPVVATALQGLRAHRDFTAMRTWLLWLPYNLLDFAMWLGVGSAVALAVVWLGRDGRSTAWRIAACACVGLFVSDVSGTARGEVGRLWMPFMPLVLVAAWSEVTFTRARDAVVVGAAMMAYCVAIRLHWIVW